MPWKLSYLEDLKIVKTVYTEPAKLEELMEAVAANIIVAKEKQTNLVLGDCTALTETGETMDIYELGLFIESLQANWAIKEAIVAPINRKNVVKDLHFFETVAQNRMIMVRLFEDIEVAIDWLLAK